MGNTGVIWATITKERTDLEVREGFICLDQTNKLIRTLNYGPIATSVSDTILETTERHTGIVILVESLVILLENVMNKGR